MSLHLWAPNKMDLFLQFPSIYVLSLGSENGARLIFFFLLSFSLGPILKKNFVDLFYSCRQFFEKKETKTKRNFFFHHIFNNPQQSKLATIFTSIKTILLFFFQYQERKKYQQLSRKKKHKFYFQFFFFFQFPGRKYFSSSQKKIKWISRGYSRFYFYFFYSSINFLQLKVGNLKKNK